ncbi:hypothetical protein [Halosimplex pelagicum]|uniref:STAS/SEC14 domain-containing protein n=1 Tax=Halosimplex pelagicum TaxID=869886 RepID=A0A7D5TCJ0_9EURY|nr:hypothetical protein [Halosimplex pelagicum]QLH83153.1 hypothetical protein HZS54_16630 [Halosimplex pelagicum]
MSAETIEDATNYTIEWDDDIEAIVFTWDEYVSGQTFRDACEALLDAIKRKNASKALTDTRSVNAHDAEDQEWLRNDWMPRALDVGLEYSAIVHPDSVIAEMDVESMMDGADPSGAAPFLTSDVAEARQWLGDQ